MTESTPPTLGSAVSIAKGKKHEVTDSPSGKAKRLIGIDDLRNDDLIRYTDDASGIEAISDDVLIAWDGANAGTIGYGKNGYIGSTIARLRISADIQLFTPFLGMYLKSKFAYLRQTATGATIPHINRNALESILLPPIKFDDQKRIAHLLDKVEGLIARRKQHLQQLDALLKSVFLEMFGDPVRNAKGWDKDRIGRSTKVQGGFAFKSKDLLAKGHVRLVKIANVHFERLVWDDVSYVPDHFHANYIRFALCEGDLLIALTRPIIKSLDVVKTATVSRNDLPCLLNQRVARFVFDEAIINKKFFLQYCYTNFFRNTVEKLCPPGLQPNISTNQIEDIPIYYPPIDLQNQFATIVEKVEGIKSRYQQSLIDLESLYGALSQKAFKGELDLSRMLLPADQPGIAEKEKPNVEEKQPMEPLFELPAPGELAVLQTAEGRKSLLDNWLNAWLGNLGETPFSAQAFMEAARQRLWELAEDDARDWGLAEYDELKAWVFEALKEGRLTQGYDDDNNLVQLKVANP